MQNRTIGVRFLTLIAAFSLLGTLAIWLFDRNHLGQDGGPPAQKGARQGFSTPLPHANEKSFPPPAGPTLTEGPLTVSRFLNVKLSLEDAKLLLQRCQREVADISERSGISSAIIGSLCRQGLIKEAWSLLDTSPGHVRTSQILTFFQSSESASLDQLAGFIYGLNDRSDREYALGSLVRGRPEAILQMDSALFPGQTPRERGEFSKSLYHVFSLKEASGIEQELVERIIQFTASGKLEAGNLLFIFSSGKDSDSFKHWDTVNQAREHFDGKVLESVHAGLAKRMIRSNANQAMETICTQQGTKYSYPVISAAIKTFYDLSASQANSWVTANLDRFDPATSQRIISCVAQVANQNLEFETSRQWANRILNPQMRQQLLDQVDKREAEKSKQPTK